MIMFVGSVFSPYYFWSGRNNPDAHCAFNVALYGKGVKRWSMTERPEKAVHRDKTNFVVGPSAMHWDGNALVLEVDEISAPLPYRLKGRIRLSPTAITDTAFQLDPHARHRWWAVAPVARIEVAFDKPDCKWTGHGYFDTNMGSEPLEAGFTEWDWSRADLDDGAAVLYDSIDKADGRSSIGVRFDKSGKATQFEPPERRTLSSSLWRIRRFVQAEDGAANVPPAEVTRTLEDTPFYARSELETHLLGQRVPAVHESLDLKRFDHWTTRLMLPFRMPRNVFWGLKPRDPIGR
jgi:carotenoid 1,2-hydratase